VPTGRNQRPPGSPARREQFQLLRLESPQVEETLRPALKALGGGSLTTWTLAAIHHRPGAGVTGIYSVKGDRVLSGTGITSALPLRDDRTAAP
jgi:hypothetical protein